MGTSRSSPAAAASSSLLSSSSGSPYVPGRVRLNRALSACVSAEGTNDVCLRRICSVIVDYLQDVRMVLIGGHDGSNDSVSALDVFDPVANGWSSSLSASTQPQRSFPFVLGGALGGTRAIWHPARRTLFFWSNVGPDSDSFDGQLVFGEIGAQPAGGKIMQCLHPAAGPALSERLYACVERVGDLLFVFGGSKRSDPSQSLNTADSIHLVSRLFSSLPAMAVGRQFAVSCVVPDADSDGARILLVGGVGSGAVALDSAVWFDPVSNSYNPAPALPGRSRQKGFALYWPVRNCVLCGAGQTETAGKPSTSIDCLRLSDTGNKNEMKFGSGSGSGSGWAPFVPLNEARMYPTACVLGGTLVVASSAADPASRTVESFDESSERWVTTRFAAVPRRRAEGAVFVVDYADI